MEQFLYGLLAGMALGMWLAILLYTFAGRRRQRVTQRRKQARDAQPSARAQDGRPADDFDDYYEQRGAGDKTAAAQAASAPVPAPAAEQPPVAVEEEAGLDSGTGDITGADDDSVADGDTEADGDKEAGDQAETDEETYRRLVDKLGGDAEAAERLINYERERAPAAPRSALIRNALDRLDYGAQ